MSTRLSAFAAFLVVSILISALSLATGVSTMKYLRGTPARVGQKILTDEQYNAQATKLENAMNRNAAPGEVAEQRGKVFKMGGLLSTDPAVRIPGELRRSDKKGNYRLRVGIGSESTLQLLVALTNWDIQVAIQEGADGATFSSPPNQITFTVPRFRIPVVGGTIDLGGDWEQVQIFNETSNALLYDISAAIIEGRAQEDTVGFENNSGGAAPIFAFSHHFSVTVPGGVQVGDTIQQHSYAGVLLSTVPAREGGIWACNLRAATVTYVPAAGVVSNLMWTFYRRI